MCKNINKIITLKINKSLYESFLLKVIHVIYVSGLYKILKYNSIIKDHTPFKIIDIFTIIKTKYDFNRFQIHLSNLILYLFFFNFIKSTYSKTGGKIVAFSFLKIKKYFLFKQHNNKKCIYGVTFNLLKIFSIYLLIVLDFLIKKRFD